MKNVVITGASEGIGKAIAMAFAQENCHLHLSARNESKLLELKKNLSKKNNAIQIHTLSIDLENKKNVSLLAKDVLKKFSKIDVLVNNVGQFIPASILSEPDGSLEKMIQINLYSAYYLTKYLLPNFLKHQAGHIFNLCSIASLKAYPNGGSYSISKYALLGFSDNLRDELKSKGIKVSAVLPGATMSNSWAGSKISKNRIMEAEDIATMILAASKLSPMAVVENIVLRPQLGDL